MKPSGNTILITGGGSGIGAALAARFRDAGNSVIVAGRRREALEEVIAGHPEMHALELDVASAAGIADFARRLLAAHPAVNVLINNAGMMRLESLDTARDMAVVEEIVATNLLGPMRLIDALVDHLAGQPDAAIVNVTSGLAFVPLTVAATYCATKAAMHSYTVSLREALAGRIEVIELAPPGVQTALTPGQENRPGYMPLDAFTDAAMADFARQPTPGEIVIERARRLRSAEAENRFHEALVEMNAFAAGARGE